jgi:hypothetical protein
MREALDVRLHL